MYLAHLELAASAINRMDMRYMIQKNANVNKIDFLILFTSENAPFVSTFLFCLNYCMNVWPKVHELVSFA